MSPTRRTIKTLAGIALFFYLALLTRNILFRNGGPRYYKNYFTKEYKRYSVKQGWQKANTVPFRTINMYKKGMEHHNTHAEYNLLGNLVGFVPFGILLPLFIPWFRHFLKILFAGFLLSLGFEMAQLVTGLGVWDVDDLLLNTAGTVIGFILFFIGWAISRLFTPNRKKAIA